MHRVPSRRLAAHEAGVRGAVGYLAAATPIVRRLLREERYDVVHFVFSLPTAAMLPLLDLHGAPVIVSLRGSDVPATTSHCAVSSARTGCCTRSRAGSGAERTGSSSRRKAWASWPGGPIRGCAIR